MASSSTPWYMESREAPRRGAYLDRLYSKFAWNRAKDSVTNANKGKNVGAMVLRIANAPAKTRKRRRELLKNLHATFKRAPDYQNNFWDPLELLGIPKIRPPRFSRYNTVNRWSDGIGTPLLSLEGFPVALKGMLVGSIGSLPSEIMGKIWGFVAKLEEELVVSIQAIRRGLRVRRKIFKDPVTGWQRTGMGTFLPHDDSDTEQAGSAYEDHMRYNIATVEARQRFTQLLKYSDGTETGDHTE